MRTVDLIQKKRDGGELSREELAFLIQGYAKGTIPDYQMSAWAMAVYFKGMSERETADLTLEMALSGDQVDLSDIAGTKVDKHSTGGVGDKTSLIVVPLVAAAGIPVAKMSGRGLGHTGGTVDKLESIEGFRIELTREQFIRNVNKNKMALAGQSGNLAPADKKLYALRDVTATVNSIPLIASSIMSKKIASGAHAIVLDVKVGSGAFMKSFEEAKRLAETMVGIGKQVGRKTIAVLSNMDEPLGYEIGNANEIAEAVDVLSGRGEKRLTELCLTLAAYMGVAGGVYGSFQEAYAAMERLLLEGNGLQTFRTFVEAQFGNPAFLDNRELLPQAVHHIEVVAERSGFVQSIDAEKIGYGAMLLGAGRATKDEAIDYSAGVSVRKKAGDAVAAGEVLAVLHTNREQVEESGRIVLQSFVIAEEAPAVGPIVYEVIE